MALISTMVLVSVVAAGPEHATAGEHAMHWEYDLRDVQSLAALGGWLKTNMSSAPTGTFSDPTILKGLNRLGEEGWEFVGTLPGNNSVVLLMFKKRKE
jgi:hypothetical protein